MRHFTKRETGVFCLTFPIVQDDVGFNRRLVVKSCFPLVPEKVFLFCFSLNLIGNTIWGMASQLRGE